MPSSSFTTTIHKTAIASEYRGGTIHLYTNTDTGKLPADVISHRRPGAFDPNIIKTS